MLTYLNLLKTYRRSDDTAAARRFLRVVILHFALHMCVVCVWCGKLII